MLSVICILCVALALWLAATLFLWHRELLEIQKALDNLVHGRTTIAIAHRLSTIKNADLICVFHEGEIVERGTHDELIELQGYYHKLHSMQNF